MTHPVKTVTVERVARILNDLGVSFTLGSVKRLIDDGKLHTVKRPYNSPQTSGYGYLIACDSLEQYFLSEGMTAQQATFYAHG